MATYTIETPRGKRLTIESDSPEEATRLADRWDLEDHAVSEAQRLGVNPDLALRQMQRESGGNPNAVSPKGARGPMQLMPGTARDLGVNPDDPYQNITGGLTYYKQQLDRFGGDERKALAAYNAGPGAVVRAGGVPNYPETQAYVGSLAGKGGAVPQRQVGPTNAPVVPQRQVVSATTPAKSQRLGFEQEFVKPYQHVSSWIEGAMDKAGYKPAAWLDTISRNLQSAEAKAEAQHPEVYAQRPGKVGGFFGGVAGTSPLMFLPGGAAVQGAATGAVSSDKKDLKGIAQDAAMGAAIGKATDVGLGMIGKGLNRVLTKAPTVPTAEALETAKNAAYSAVDSAGVKFKPSTFDGLVTATAQDLKAANYNPTQLHGKVAGVMKEFEKMRGSSPTLTELDQFRQFARTEIMDGGTRGEQRLGKIILGNIDDFINSAGAKQVASGDPKAAAALIRNARDLNTRVAKTEAVNQALDNAGLTAKAAGSGANVDNRTRQEVLKVLKKTGNFTPEEEAAARKAIQGGPVQNVLRGIGKTSPLNGGIPGILNTLAVLPTGGTSLAWAIPSSAAKMTADRMTTANVDDLLRLIAAGGSRSALARAPTVASGAASTLLKGAQTLLPPAAVVAASQARARPASTPMPQRKK